MQHVQCTRIARLYTQHILSCILYCVMSLRVAYVPVDLLIHAALIFTSRVVTRDETLHNIHQFHFFLCRMNCKNNNDTRILCSFRIRSVESLIQ